MNKTRVVVVDDSAFMRKLISDIINEEVNLEVVAKFKNGQELLNEIDRINPDVVTLDLEMPILDGLSTLKELKKRSKQYNIIMLSSLTGNGSIHTIQCLEEGAIDFVKKPSGSISLDIHKIGNKLIDKINAIVEDKQISKKSGQNSNINTIVNREVKTKGKVEAVVIGASTGGPKALQNVLAKIEYGIDIPIFVVQHMPSGFTKAFAERLDLLCKLKVVEAEEGMIVEKNTIYIAQGGYHMTIGKNKKIVLSKDPTMWGVRPAVDKLFDSAVETYGGNLISVILTGMGRDGAMGTEKVKEAGGVTIAEDKSTCIIYGMPKAAYETGKVDIVLPLEKVAEKINALVKGR